jgi:hypothetical protein
MSGKGVDGAFAVVSNQAVAYTATAAATATAFSDGIHHIRISATTACHYKLAGTPVATTSDTYLPANVIEIIRVNPGQKISFIRNATDGSASVSQMSK